MGSTQCSDRCRCEKEISVDVQEEKASYFKKLDEKGGKIVAVAVLSEPPERTEDDVGLGSSIFDAEAGELPPSDSAVQERRPTVKYKTGAEYTGEWMGNSRHGCGRQVWPTGAMYSGEWLNSKAHGKGRFHHVNGDVFIGQFHGNKAHGDGVYMGKDGTVYRGADVSDINTFVRATSGSRSEDLIPHGRPFRRMVSDETEYKARVLDDPRRACSVRLGALPTLQLQQCANASPSRVTSPESRQVTPTLRVSIAQRAEEALLRCVHKVCGACLPWVAGRQQQPLSPKLPAPPRRWYRVHPVGDVKYFVRPDAGRRGKVPGVRDKAFDTLLDNSEAPDVQQLKSRRKGTFHVSGSRSMPDFIERRICLKEPCGLHSDPIKDRCRICYENPIEVVLLPCRHGTLCHECLRKTFNSKPAHRGGRNCPFCRRRVREVIFMYGDAAIPQYGFTLKVPL